MTTNRWSITATLGWVCILSLKICLHFIAINLMRAKRLGILGFFPRKQISENDLTRRPFWIPDLRCLLQMVSASLWDVYIFPSNAKETCENKKVLLRERKRHTTRHVACTSSAVLSRGYPIPGWGYPIWDWGTPRKGPGTSGPVTVVPPGKLSSMFGFEKDKNVDLYYFLRLILTLYCIAE